ncbi:hypothetical protein GGI02_001674 [Coemansia sp. RSA 2322]|nr:hypothetical protein GGI02_001674 [Coemansia sp. RSA 2322]
MDRLLRPVLSWPTPAVPALAARLHLHRRGIGMLQSRHANKVAQADSPETSPSISTVSRNLSSLFQGTPAPAPVDPHFEVVDSGHGSLVLAKLPPYSQLYAQVGQTLGQSPRARSRATTRGAAAVAALRPLLGRQAFVQEISTQADAAEILLAPRLPGDVVVVGMDGACDYFVRKSCLLAQTKFLTLSTWNAIGAAFNPLAFDKLIRPPQTPVAPRRNGHRQ